MAQGSKSNGSGNAVRDAVTKTPAAERLLGEVENFLRDRALDLVDSIGDRISDATERLEDFAANGGKSLSNGESPLKAGAKALGGSLKDTVGGLLGGGSSNGSGPVKSTLIEESIDVGVPVSVAYNQWTQFQEFGRFTKGVQSVDQEDDTTTNWKAKIAFSTRSWQANITEQVPDERIAWTADGDKGSVDGVVPFHELAPNLTRVLLELEYPPKGVLEKTANMWRAQGRRARLDLKHFRAFVMMRGEETGAWRGEVRDGDVSRSPGKRSRRDDGEQDSGRRRRRQDDNSSRGRGRSSRREERQRPEPRRRRRERSSAQSNRASEERSARRSARSRAGDGAASGSSGDTKANRARKSSSSTRRRRRASAATTSQSSAKRSPAKATSSANGSASNASARNSSASTRKKTTSRKKTTPAAKRTARK